jgi:hypothetical protein
VLKDSFLHLPVFLLIFALVLTIIVCFSLLAAWTGLYNPAFPLQPGWLGKQLPAIIGKALPVSVLASLFGLFFRIRRKPGNRLLSFVLPIAASFIVLAAGISFVYGPAGSPPPKEYGSLNPFTPKTIHETKEGLIFTDAVSGARDAGDGIRLDNLIRYADGALHYDRAAAVAVRSAGDTQAAVIISSSASKQPVTVTPANPVYQRVFESPGIIASLAVDANTLNQFLHEKRTQSPEDFALAVFSILLLAMGCICFLRLTRWPLFNALLTLVFFRGIFLILRFFESDIGREVAGMISNKSIQELLPTLSFLALGVVLAAINLFFPGRKNG